VKKRENERDTMDKLPRYERYKRMSTRTRFFFLLGKLNST
jgi:hypothetical protein